MVVAGVARLRAAGVAEAIAQAIMPAMAEVVAEVIVVVVLGSAEAHARPTRASRAITQVTASRQASPVRPMRRASATHSRHESTASNSARTHAAHVLTHALISAMILTNANLPVMSLRAFHHLACLPGAPVVVAVAEAVVAAAVAAEISAVAAHARVAVVGGAILAADFGADSPKTP